jgi:hypothetical protein
MALVFTNKDGHKMNLLYWSQGVWVWVAVPKLQL